MWPRDQSSAQHYSTVVPIGCAADSGSQSDFSRLLRHYHSLDMSRPSADRYDHSGEADFHRYLRSVTTQIVPPSARHFQNGSVYSSWKPRNLRTKETTLPSSRSQRTSVKATLTDLKSKLKWFGRSDNDATPTGTQWPKSQLDIDYPPRLIDVWNAENNDEPTVLEVQNVRNNYQSDRKRFNQPTAAAVANGVGKPFKQDPIDHLKVGDHFDRRSPNLEFLRKLNKRYGSVERYSVYIKLIALVHLLLGLFMLTFDVVPPAMMWNSRVDSSGLRYKQLCRLTYSCLILSIGVLCYAAGKRRKTICLVALVLSVSLLAMGLLAPGQMPFVESLFEAAQDTHTITTSRVDIRRSIDQHLPDGKTNFVPIGTFTLRSFGTKTEALKSPPTASSTNDKAAVIRDLQIVYGVFGLTHFIFNIVTVYFCSRYYHILMI